MSLDPEGMAADGTDRPRNWHWRSCRTLTDRTAVPSIRLTRRATRGWRRGWARITERSSTSRRCS